MPSSTPDVTVDIEPLPSESNAPNQPVFSKDEIFSFEWLRKDWTRDQMEELGLEKNENPYADEINYFDDSIAYIYLEPDEILTPGVVDVYGDYLGPRGIKVSDTFEEVMKRLPQHENWEENNSGTFYGEFHNDAEEYDNKLSGHVDTYGNDKKEITLLTEKVYPFMRIFFENDVVTHYTFFLISTR